MGGDDDRRGSGEVHRRRDAAIGDVARADDDDRLVACNGFAMFSVVEKSSGRWVGRLGPWMPDGWPGTEVGWAIVRDCWGKGYATEGAIAATDWAFDNLGWTDVIHSIDPANIASQQVARKLGSRNRGRGSLPAPFQDTVIDIWGQSREEWRARPDKRV